jgi:hypothetical protein
MCLLFRYVRIRLPTDHGHCFWFLLCGSKSSSIVYVADCPSGSFPNGVVCTGMCIASYCNGLGWLLHRRGNRTVQVRQELPRPWANQISPSVDCFKFRVAATGAGAWRWLFHPNLVITITGVVLFMRPIGPAPIAGCTPILRSSGPVTCTNSSDSIANLAGGFKCLGMAAFFNDTVPNECRCMCAII